MEVIKERSGARKETLDPQPLPGTLNRCPWVRWKETKRREHLRRQRVKHGSGRVWQPTVLCTDRDPVGKRNKFSLGLVCRAASFAEANSEAVVTSFLWAAS